MQRFSLKQDEEHVTLQHLIIHTTHYATLHYAQRTTLLTHYTHNTNNAQHYTDTTHTLHKTHHTLTHKLHTNTNYYGSINVVYPSACMRNVYRNIDRAFLHLVLALIQCSL